MPRRTCDHGWGRRVARPARGGAITCNEPLSMRPSLHTKRYLVVGFGLRPCDPTVRGRATACDGGVLGEADRSDEAPKRLPKSCSPQVRESHPDSAVTQLCRRIAQQVCLKLSLREAKDSAQLRPELDRFGPDVGGCWRTLNTFCKFPPNLCDLGPRFWSKLAELWLTSANFGRAMPIIGQAQPNSGVG